MDGKVERTVNSIQKLLPILGIKSRTTVMRYMNHIKNFYSPVYKKYVNIRYPNTKSLLNHKINFETNRVIPELNIPNTSLSSLELNTLYVYDKNFSLVYKYKSIRKAVRYLNPNYKEKGINLRAVFGALVLWCRSLDFHLGHISQSVFGSIFGPFR